jgi:hypothetical protein
METSYVPNCSVEPRPLREIEVKTHELFCNIADSEFDNDWLFIELKELGWEFDSVEFGLDPFELEFRYIDSTYESEYVAIVLVFTIKKEGVKYTLVEFEIFDD